LINARAQSCMRRPHERRLGLYRAAVRNANKQVNLRERAAPADRE